MPREAKYTEPISQKLKIVVWCKIEQDVYLSVINFQVYSIELTILEH